MFPCVCVGVGVGVRACLRAFKCVLRPVTRVVVPGALVLGLGLGLALGLG